MTTMITQSDFQFSGVDVDNLTSSEYTLVTLAIDMSSSVSYYNTELRECIKTIIETCKKSNRAENLMIRLTSFNSQIFEEHGFKTLSLINVGDYTQIRNPSGMTALYDACIDSIEATEQYGKTLTDQEFETNGVLYIITDGDDNRSQHSLSDVAERFKKLKYTESLESLQTFLIGVNVNEPMFKNYLEDFKNTVGFDEFISIENANTDTLSKLANFISKSISLQSQSLGTGSVSNALPSF
tara:strand:+ start:2616 stop:3335 length:720 start_codon:yes stop_codon:yes gene_type:complete